MTARQWDGGMPYRHDYGPKGCCGPEMAAGVGGLVLLAVGAVKAARRLVRGGVR